MVRKSELQDAIWDEVDFENAVWTIPKERMKRSKAHNVYLSRQMLDILIALKTCAGAVLPAKPGALGLEPLEAAEGVADAAPRIWSRPRAACQRQRFICSSL